jgi:hypothetical protein
MPISGFHKIIFVYTCAYPEFEAGQHSHSRLLQTSAKDTAVCSPRKLVTIQQTTKEYNSEDHNINFLGRENLSLLHKFIFES